MMKKFYICVILLFSFFITTQVRALSSSSYTMEGFAYNPNSISGVSTTDFTAESLSFKGFYNISIDYTKTSMFRFRLSDLSTNLSNSTDSYLAFLLYDTYDGVPVVWNGNVACNVNPSLNSSVQVNVVDNSSVIIPYDKFGNVYSVTCSNGSVTDSHITLNIEHGVRSGYSPSGVYRISVGILPSIRYTKSEFEFLSDIYSSINNSNVTQQQIIQEQQKTTEEVSKNTQAVNDVNNSINSTDTTGSENALSSIVNDPAFQDTTGINSIITLPLTMISSLSNTCQPINVTIPFINTSASLPCFRSIINQHMPLLSNMISIVINGFILYRVFIDIVGIIKSARNPDEDRLDVLEL